MNAVRDAWPLWLIAGGFVVRHVWRLARHPYGKCWACGGTGKNRGSTASEYGWCQRCKHTGRRLRVGATVLHPRLRDRK